MCPRIWIGDADIADLTDASRYLGIGRSTLYILMARDELEVVKFGCAKLVLTASLGVVRQTAP